VNAITPDYDEDPERWASWESPTDVHELVAAELNGAVLDVGCGEGRLASHLRGGVQWVGVDRSAAQLRRSPRRTAVAADMRALPFPDAAFAAVTHLWCLYHLDDPSVAIEEARRVLRPGGRYYASTAARNNDPELAREGYPRTSFDAEEAVTIVSSVFGDVDAQRWDGRFYRLETREEVRSYCRHSLLAPGLAETVDLPLSLTKRGVLVRAVKTRTTA
jgi:SAM-dependent methyltransferase